MTQDAVWYTSAHGQQYGPYTHAQVVQMIQAGQCDASAYVSAPHLAGWIAVSREPSLAPYLSAATAAAETATNTAASTPEADKTAKTIAKSLKQASKDAKRAKKLAWIFLGIALFCLALIPMMLLDTDDNEGSPHWGALMLAVGFGIPGALKFRRYRLLTFRIQVLGFITSRDRISVPEVARAIKKTDLEAEQLIAQLNLDEGLNLKFDPETRHYLHLHRLSGTQKVAEKCPTCGAPVDTQFVMKHERVTCKYCGAVVSN